MSGYSDIAKKYRDAYVSARQDFFIHPAYAARPVRPFEPKPAPWQMVRRIRAALLRLRISK